jgi:hypothetical protein
LPNKLPRSKLRGIKRKKHCLGAKQASGNRTLQGIEILQGLSITPLGAGNDGEDHQLRAASRLPRVLVTGSLATLVYPSPMIDAFVNDGSSQNTIEAPDVDAAH